MKKPATIAEAIVAVRERRSISTRDLGKLIGCSGPYVSQMEASDYKDPVPFLRKLWPVLTKEERVEIKEILKSLIDKELPV